MKARASHRLRHQVARERRIRNLIFFVIMAGAFLYMGINLFLGDMGLIKYYSLKRTQRSLEAEIRGMEKENSLVGSQIHALKNDPYYIEKQAREEYGLARPDEFIFQFQDQDQNQEKAGNER
ncbi:MAG: septum formation initiator family protein [Thermodesulfovibrionales bacterium]|jgi:cell division protein FtsB